VTYNPLGYVIVWFGLNVWFFFQSLFLISIFSPKRKENKSGQIGNSPKTSGTSGHGTSGTSGHGNSGHGTNSSGKTVELNERKTISG